MHRAVIAEVFGCREAGIVYNGDKYYKQSGQTIGVRGADCSRCDRSWHGLSIGYGFVNDNRAAVPRSAGTAHPLHVSIAAVHGAMVRLKLVTTNFLIFKQVSSDVNSPWAKASFL